MLLNEDLSGPLVTCTGNTGRSPVLTGELVPVDGHGLHAQVTNGPDWSSEVLVQTGAHVRPGAYRVTDRVSEYLSYENMENTCSSFLPFIASHFHGERLLPITS